MSSAVTNTSPAAAEPPTEGPRLARKLTLTHAVLYGLGVTIGAGIYVLVGPAVGRAGIWAPVAFAIAALLMAFTAASFAELGGRLPVAAGEAAYVRAGFRSDHAATAAGLLVVAIAIVSAAAISVGSAGYIGAILPLPQGVIIAGVVIAMGLIAAWGIEESVTFAGVMTVIEVSGLVLLVVAGLLFGASVPPGGTPPPPASLPPPVLAGLMSATLLAVFAFIGFEGIANVAEELRRPERDLPRAIFITLIVTTVLYIAVVMVAQMAATREELAANRAPLALVFERITHLDPRIMTLIAIVATINGIIVQIIMASRVLYGLARQGGLPSFLGDVHTVTHTPLKATALATVIVLVLALSLPLDRLADWTSRMTLVLFAAVNASLILVKRHEAVPPAGILQVPAWVPWAGVITTLAVLLGELIAG